MATKRRPSLSAMDEFDLEAKIKKATESGIKTIATTQEDVVEEEKFVQKVVVEENKPAKKKTKKPLGRPKKNPYPDEKKLTIRMPESLHRQLRFASADTGKPMVEIAIDALIQYLKEYKKR